MEESFQKYASRDGLQLHGQVISFGADRRCARRALAAYLQGLGLAKGDRVAIMMPNVPQYPVAVAAILRAGCVVVNVNPLYTPRELEHQLKDSGAKAIVIIENFAAHAAAVHRQHAGQARGAGRHGRPARPAQGRAGQLRRAQRQEDGAGLRPAGRRALQRRDGPRPRGKTFSAARGQAPTTWPCCSTPAAPPACPRAPCCCIAT